MPGSPVGAQPGRRRVAVLGAAGRVGRQVVGRALAQGWAVTGQSRRAERLAEFAGRIRVRAFEPGDAAAYPGFLEDADAVVFALGSGGGSTRLFSETTAVLLPAMAAAGVRRLVAITGVGAGETRGHGGWLYDRVVFPLFTRARYRDKERQEALIAASDRDWVIVRPAPFSNRAAAGPLEVHCTVGPETVLRRVTPAEVADFVVAQLDGERYLRQRPFIGHP